MNFIIKLSIISVFIIFSASLFAQKKVSKIPVCIVMHGGAGNISRENISKDEEKRIVNVMTEALDSGYAMLKSGARSIEVIETVLKIMEDSPEFNAGRGAVFNSRGEHELDAAIMDGSNLNAGAVSGVKHIKHPVSAARLVMEHSKHVLLTGEGAEEFVKPYHLKMVENDYFDTEKRKIQLKKIRQQEGEGKMEDWDVKHGTVGAVVLDGYGNIAAGTSTGGLTNKRFGRIGDSPIIGAGTYANNNTCGISCTGVGEFFMRGVVAYDISALMEYKNYSLEKAASKVVKEKLVKMGGEGGIIGLDKNGNISMVFNSEGMIRGFVDKNGKREVKLFKK